MESKKLVEKYPLCQLRTARHKAYTFLWGKKGEDGLWRGDFILKGPFLESRLDGIMAKFEALGKVGAKSLVYPLERKDNFLIYPNLAKEVPQAELERTSNCGDEVVVLERSVLKKLGDVLFTAKLSRKNLLELMITMLHLYSLEVGDVSLSNILYHEEKKKAWIIDIDDQRHKTWRDDEIFYFVSIPRKEKLDHWLSLVRPLYKDVLKHFVEDPSTAGSREIPFELLIPTEGIPLNIPSSEEPNENSRSEEEDSDEVSQEVWNGMRASKTRSGLPMDIAKSGLQKNIRRNVPDQAQYFAYELWSLGQLAQAARTNLYNRLAIIAMEDVGPANVPLVLATIQLVAEKKDFSLETLLSFVRALAASPKTRLVSHAWKGVRALRKDFSVPKRLLSHVKWRPKDPPEVREVVDLFFHELLKKSPREQEDFFFLTHLMDLVYNEKFKGLRVTPRPFGPHERRSVVMAAVWEGLEKLSSSLKPLRDFYFSHEFKEKPYFVVLASLIVALGLGDLEAEWPPIEEVPEEILDLSYKLRVDPFVVDMHTAAGKRMGRTRKDFVHEGAVVIPEDMSLHYPDLVSAYNNF